MTSHSVTQRDVWKAKNRIAPWVTKSPLIYSKPLSETAGSPVHLKLENLHPAYSFKIRGAANKMLNLPSQEQKRGVVTFSTGNFGLSVAYMAKKLHINAVICISRWVPQTKIETLKRFGAQIEMSGNSQDDAENRGYQLAKEHGLTLIHPFDDGLVIAGQGTIGLEILEEMPEVDTVIGGLSGGGLHAGLGVALKTADPNIRITGISTIRGPAMYESIKQGEPVTVTEQNTLADSLLGGIGRDNHYTMAMVKQYVDDILLLDDDSIARGMVFMLEQERMVVEGAAASGIGAILDNRVQLGSHAVVVVSGCNVDPMTMTSLNNPFDNDNV
ncbi:hydroxyectoine utilization dehydratase EutB [Barrientosiimonas marina]|uniref:Pyridoxal-phosphate dependent enzyme n=1 Tax=Lentibacillus kimchii TaxID=1542911 RepID=A0ABW2UXI3_9BACI